MRVLLHPQLKKRNNKDDTLLIKNSKKELKNKFIYFNDEVNNYQFYKYLECKLKTENILLEYLYIDSST